MNFKKFCDIIISLVHVEDDDCEDEFWDDEYCNELYIAFKESYYTDPTEWAIFWFGDLQPGKHRFYLKSKIE